MLSSRFASTKAISRVALKASATWNAPPGTQTTLDVATVSLSQPDGATSLLSGGSTVNSYMFSPPFIQQMMGKPNVRRVVVQRIVRLARHRARQLDDREIPSRKP